MRLSSKQPFPFILKKDEEVDKSEQTIWWIVPTKGVADVPKIEDKFKRSEVEKFGKTNIDKRLRAEAYESTLLMCVEKIDNIGFPIDSEFYKNGDFYDIEEENIALKKAAFSLLSANEMAEIVEAASLGYSLSEVEKKNTNPNVLSPVATRQPKASRKTV